MSKTFNKLQNVENSPKSLVMDANEIGPSDAQMRLPEFSAI